MRGKFANFAHRSTLSKFQDCSKIIYQADGYVWFLLMGKGEDIGARADPAKPKRGLLEVLGTGSVRHKGAAAASSEKRTKHIRCESDFPGWKDLGQQCIVGHWPRLVEKKVHDEALQVRTTLHLTTCTRSSSHTFTIL
jgi:hypothetical protein